MNRMTCAVLAIFAAGCGAASIALAQSQFPTAAPSDKVSAFALAAPTGQTLAGLPVMGPVSPTNPLPVVTSPNSTTGSTTAVTVGTSSAQALAAAVSVRRFLAIDNESTTAAVACAFGATAALNTAGSWTIPPGMTRTWNGTFVPSDAVNCIAGAAGTPVTVEAN
jgi:Zn-dependent alcohol dehydrogenase